MVFIVYFVDIIRGFFVIIYFCFEGSMREFLRKFLVYKDEFFVRFVIDKGGF